MKEIGKRPYVFITIFLAVTVSILLIGEMVQAAGDDFNSATEIEVPGDFSGELTNENEEDYYKFINFTQKETKE